MSRIEMHPPTHGRGAEGALPPATASHAALFALPLVAVLVCQARPAGASYSELRDAGERYAASDPTGAVAILTEVIGRKGKTDWVAEALYLRAMILARDLGKRQDALRDLRRMTVRFAGTEAAAFGQFSIARIYEEAGLVADAYREYVLCSRLRGIRFVRPSERERGHATMLPSQSRRVTPERGAEFVRLASERAALLFGRLPAGGMPTEAGLSPRTFVATGPVSDLEIPADPRGKPSSGERSDVWYAVAPAGSSITGVTAQFEAVVDPAAAGPDGSKSYKMLVERLSGGDTGMIELRGTKTRAEELRGRAAAPGGAGALRVTVFRSGARVLRCRMVVEVANTPPAPPKASAAPGGFTFAVPPSEKVVGGVDLAQAGGRIFLVWHARGSWASPFPVEHSDLYMSSSADGATWTPPRRLAVSSAVDDCCPSVGALPDGRILLAWTSDRRGPGTSDIYTSESPDGVRWSKPARLDIDPRDLDSMGPRILPGGVGLPSSIVTLHRPEVSVCARGAARVFFVAHGTRRSRTAHRSTVSRLNATGVYGVISSGAGLWSKPVMVVATPKTSLGRYRPAPKSRDREVVSALAPPAVIERRPGSSLVGWISSCGRAFLTQRDKTGKWTHYDTRFAGTIPTEAADDVEIIGPVDDTYGVLLLRRDSTPKLIWRDKRGRTGWRVTNVEPAVKPGAFAEVAAVALEGRRSWLTAWTASGTRAWKGVCVKKIAAPPAPRP
jgi:hypothetical protein